MDIRNSVPKNELFLPKDIANSLVISTPSYLPKIDDNPIVEGKLCNVWHSNDRRNKFHHLSEHPICICGAGDDMKFIYNNPDTIENVIDQPREKSRRRRKKTENKTLVKIPEKLSEKELNIVSHFGVNKIEFINESFTTSAVEHMNHKICFPVLHPNNNKLARKTLESIKPILEKIDFNNLSSELLPTSLHRLLAVVKKEQDLYNSILYNVIKETTVDCIERGELLATVRERYRNIYVQIPRSVKNFQDNIIVRRILDRRLTEELTRFQTCVSRLSSELEAVKQHEEGINRLVHNTKTQLQEAVQETKTNADLLREYHGLYEFQRRRLEKAVVQLEEERISWKDATYQFTEMVLQKYKMSTGLSLVESENRWFSNGEHLVNLLIEIDSKTLATIKQKTTQWQKEAVNFMDLMKKRDFNVGKVIDSQIQKLKNLEEELDDEYFNEKDQMDKPIERAEVVNIYNLLLAVEESLMNLSEIFGGNIMLKEEEKLTKMKRICAEFTDLGIELFNRHKIEQVPNKEKIKNEVIDEEEHDDTEKEEEIKQETVLFPEHKVLLNINLIIEKMMNQLSDQLTGDNGVIDGISTLQNYIENWLARLSSCLNITNGLPLSNSGNNDPVVYRALPQSDWVRFKSTIIDWIGLLNESKQAIGRVTCPITSPSDKSDDTLRTITREEVLQQLSSWCQRSNTSIESENLRLRETVSSLHLGMVRWSAHILLRLAPDHPGNSPEARRAARVASVGFREMFENQELLEVRLGESTKLLTRCTKDLVSRLQLEKIEKQVENPNEDNEKLLELDAKSHSWINYSKELLKQMMEQEYDSQIRAIEPKDKTEEVKSPSKTLKNQTAEIVEDKSDDDEEEDVNLTDLIGGIMQSVTANMDDNLEDTEDPYEEYDDKEEDENNDEGILSIPQDPDRVQGIGADMNIHWRYLIQNPDSEYSGDKFSAANLLNDDKATNEELPRTKEAHKVIRVFEVLQDKVKELTEEIITTDHECSTVEMELKKTQDTYQLLQGRFKKISDDLNQLKDEKDKELSQPALFSKDNTLEKGISQIESDKKSSKSSAKSNTSSMKKRAPKRGGITKK